MIMFFSVLPEGEIVAIDDRVEFNPMLERNDVNGIMLAAVSNPNFGACNIAVAMKRRANGDSKKKFLTYVRSASKSELLS